MTKKADKKGNNESSIMKTSDAVEVLKGVSFVIGVAIFIILLSVFLIGAVQLIGPYLGVFGVGILGTVIALFLIWWGLKSE